MSTPIPSARLDAIFSALAHPVRRGILDQLANGPAPVVDLCAPLSISQPAVSKHLKVLEAAGLISRERQGQARLAHLDAAPMAHAARWIDDYRKFWAASFDRLDALLATMKETRDE